MRVGQNRDCLFAPSSCKARRLAKGIAAAKMSKFGSPDSAIPSNTISARVMSAK